MRNYFQRRLAALATAACRADRRWTAGMNVLRRSVILLLGTSGVLAVFAGAAHAIGVVPANHCEPFAATGAPVDAAAVDVPGPDAGNSCKGHGAGKAGDAR